LFYGLTYKANELDFPSAISVENCQQVRPRHFQARLEVPLENFYPDTKTEPRSKISIQIMYVPTPDSKFQSVFAMFVFKQIIESLDKIGL